MTKPKAARKTTPKAAPKTAQAARAAGTPKAPKVSAQQEPQVTEAMTTPVQASEANFIRETSVSYTHLTLPTICSV